MAQNQALLDKQTQYAEGSDFSSLLQKEFKPKTDEAKEAVQVAVRTLAEQALANTVTIGADSYKAIEAIIAEIDRKMSEQINLIIHHAEYQQLESAWRGLHYLVNNTEVDELLKIKFMPISKRDLHRTLRRHKGIGWDQSPIFKKVYEAEYDQLGGVPYGCLVGDYHFDHSPPDVELLTEMSKICAASHCPFITGAAPTTMQMETWQELANPRDLTKIFENTEYVAWRSLRNSEDSRYLGLTLPRFLSRAPYDPQKNPIDDFQFTEELGAADHDGYVWSNAAYAFGANVTRAFKLYGWCTYIRGHDSGGKVEKLPVHTFPCDDEQRGKRQGKSR